MPPTPSRDRDSDRDLTERREGGMESAGGRFTSPIPVATSSLHHGLRMNDFVGRGEYAVCCVGGLDMHSVSGGECVTGLSFGFKRIDFGRERCEFVVFRI